MTDFVKFDSQETETLWGVMETGLPEALSAADKGKWFDSPAHACTIKSTIALHYARSFDVLDSHAEIWRGGLKAAKERFLRDPAHLRYVYYLKTGLYLPLAAASAHELIAGELLERTRQLFVSGVAFRLRVVDLFKGASAVVASNGLQLLRPQRGSEFAIADVPVVTTGRSGEHQGISAGVPIGSAALVFMPLGPYLGVKLGPRNVDVTIDAEHVERLNTWELQAAHRGIFARVGSPLMDWAATIRPPSFGRLGTASRPLISLISGGGNDMPDILIRDVAEATIAEIDRRAREQGLSRVEYLRRRLDAEYRQTTSLTAVDWRRFGDAADDLDDPDVMGKAWS